MSKSSRHRDSFTRELSKIMVAVSKTVKTPDSIFIICIAAIRTSERLGVGDVSFDYWKTLVPVNLYANYLPVISEMASEAVKIGCVELTDDKIIEILKADEISQDSIDEILQIAQIASLYDTIYTEKVFYSCLLYLLRDFIDWMEQDRVEFIRRLFIY